MSVGVSKGMFVVGLVIAILASSSIGMVVSSQLSFGPKGDKGDTGLQGIQGLQGDPSEEVNVTNFPLDEQGNLRISHGASKVVTAVKDVNFSYYDYDGIYDVKNRSRTASIEVEGFREFCVHVSVRNWTTPYSDLMFRVISIVDGIESSIPPESGSTWTYSPWLGTWDGTPRTLAARYYVWSPEVQIEFWGRDANAEGWYLVSISLYLSN